MLSLHLIAESISNSGFEIIPEVFSPVGIQRIVRLLEQLGESLLDSRSRPAYAIRNLLEVVPDVRSMIESPRIRSIVTSVSGPAAFPVRGIMLDKVPQAKWIVP
jgi:hypothetical protein